MSQGCTPGEGPRDKWHGSNQQEDAKMKASNEEAGAWKTRHRSNWLDHSKETPQARSKDQAWTKGAQGEQIPPEGRCGWSNEWAEVTEASVATAWPTFEEAKGRKP